MGFDELIPINRDNLDPRVSCVLVIDDSGSMSKYTDALNDGVAKFLEKTNSDPIARKRVEVAIISFGGVARIALPFVEVRDASPEMFSASSGGTNLAAGVESALDLIRQRKDQYRSENIQFYRPWMVILTDGSPTTGDTDAAISRTHQTEIQRGVTVFPIGVGPAVNWEVLNKLSRERDAVSLDEAKFEELFLWLSDSLSNVSVSANYGDDDQSRSAGQQLALPPVTWTVVDV